MATNISPAASWTGSNMKPASGEQIDALWGQNIADNTGQLRARAMPLTNMATDCATTRQPGFPIEPNIFTTGYVYFQPFFRVQGHNYLYATFLATGYFTDGGGMSPDIYGSHFFSIGGNLGTFTSSDKYSSGNIGGAYTKGSAYRFSVDLSSYVDENTFGYILWNAIGTQSDYGAGAGTPAITFKAGTFLLYTAWA